ncbi:hypothetical protein H5410_026599 [Solanum commersonii]|uniref:Uncharacterized protein n=1 Tax=Solanum commersonii TaxID=4109 RepID=A0A9J5YWK9_SOLCO|nr:hypothetical protein H5410_026599 [Solanum commersonii]
MTWLKLGDANRSFFFASIKSRISHDRIKSLTTSTGIVLVRQDEVKNEIINFYRGLLGTAATHLPTLRGTYTKVHLRRIVCNNHGAPKWKFILFLVTSRRLLTSDRLTKWKTITDGAGHKYQKIKISN